jgi:NADPH:quinone reductase-like Zn-dependent oxidoreductase
MKAAVYSSYGPPEVVEIKDIPRPKPGDKDVLIKVHYSTVNRTDCGFRSANYFVVRFFSGLFRPKNQVLGSEFSGEIIEAGKDVSKYKIGDRVFGFNDQKFGAHAEHMLLSQDDPMAYIPENYTYENAAALTEGAHYALCDIRSAKVQAGQNVLVNGATGAIGSAAVQILKHYGAKVTAVCNTKNLDLIQSLGADAVIDYTKQDFTELDDKFDFVFDAVGKSTFGKCKSILKPKGIYISTELGPNFQNPFLAIFSPLSGGKKLLFPLPVTKIEDMQLLADLAQSGGFKPVIDRVYSLDEIVEAYTYVETGMKTGNVLIKIIE